MLGFRVAKFTTAVVVTGLLGIAALALTLDSFAVDYSGRRAAITRKLRSEAAPAWPLMAEAYRRAAPSKDLQVPPGDPVPVLTRLEQIPHAMRAFHVGPDRKLTLAGTFTGRRIRSCTDRKSGQHEEPAPRS